MYIIKSRVIQLLLLLIVTGCPYFGFAQEETTATELPADNAAREEIQRYFGYEDLFFRYTTLPYDVSASVNQKGKYVDLGYVLMALIPLMLIGLFYKKKRWFYGLIIFFSIYLMTCFQFSYVQNNLGERYNPIVGEVSSDPLNVGFAESLIAPIYSISGFISRPLVSLIGNFTGQQDHITYPLFFIIFLLGLYILLTNKQASAKQKFIATSASTFVFLWWLFSGGIIWYGYLMIPLGYAFIAYVLSIKKKEDSFLGMVLLRYLGLATLTTYLVLAGVSRISNLSGFADMNHQDTGKGIVEPRIFPYAVGAHSERESIDALAENLNLALDEMNSDSSLIIHFGSALTFDIKQNNVRSFEDNQLSYFYGIAQKYRTRTKITEYYKSVGVKYLILDLRLSTMDNTPEKSLTNKFNTLRFGFLKSNSAIKLLATDQKINVLQADGSKVAEMGLFGDDYPNLGSYAVFEIL